MSSIPDINVRSSDQHEAADVILRTIAVRMDLRPLTQLKKPKHLLTKIHQDFYLNFVA